MGLVKLVTEAIVKKSEGNGIIVNTPKNSPGDKLVAMTVEKSISKAQLRSHKITVSLKTQIPAGYGLKSSSAISTAVALACAKLFSKKIDDAKVIRAGVDASIKAGVSITGAYDDACACYYGGFCVTDNRAKKLVAAKKSPLDVHAVIYIPNKRARGNPKRLRTMSKTFERAWNMALSGDYWNAMILNGVAASATLNTDPGLVGKMIGAGALGASVSGNGPAFAAIARKKDLARVKRQFPKLQGRIITVPVNCKKASVYDL